MDKGNLIVRNSVVRIVGVFEVSSEIKKLHQKLIEFNYSQEEISDSEVLEFYKNYWYPEFRDMYFLKQEETSARIYKKVLNEKIKFNKIINPKTKEGIPVAATVKEAELFVFKDQLSFFVIDLEIAKNSNLNAYSDLTFCARNFDTEINEEKNKTSWVKWIESNILSGTKISAYGQEKKVKIDDYSGSKFKLYTVLDLEEELSVETRRELLYDVGCVAKIGSAGGGFDYTPSDNYFEDLMVNRISVFNNYDILPLFDSFTVIGNRVLDSEPTHYKNVTWKQTYFRIYIHNLLIKFSLFRYNSEMVEDSIAARDKFEEFLNNYNISHLSYNFLPNLIHQKQRESLDVESELEKFQERINRISQSIQEEQQKRSNILLAIVGFFTSISSAEPIFSFFENERIKQNWEITSFYTLISLLLIIVAVPILLYLFPEKKRKIKRKIRNRNRANRYAQ